MNILKSAKIKPKSNFFKQVHELVALIPVGKVMTYGQIAMTLGGQYSARLVGFAMHSAPKGLPCHRIVNRKGEMAKGIIFGGEEAQRKLFASEGVPFLASGQIDLEQALSRPPHSTSILP